MKINSTLNESYLLTSESVTEGHPDKLCDRIADSILDALISQDPESKVAVEVAISNQLVVLLGEVTSKAEVEFEEIAKSHNLIVTVEEHSIIGGLGSAVSEHLTTINQKPPLLSIGIPDPLAPYD